MVRIGSVAVVLALVVGLGFGGWTVLKEVQRVQLAPGGSTARGHGRS